MVSSGESARLKIGSEPACRYRLQLGSVQVHIVHVKVAHDDVNDQLVQVSVIVYLCMCTCAG